MISQQAKNHQGVNLASYASLISPFPIDSELQVLTWILTLTLNIEILSLAWNRVSLFRVSSFLAFPYRHRQSTFGNFDRVILDLLVVSASLGLRGTGIVVILTFL